MLDLIIGCVDKQQLNVFSPLGDSPVSPVSPVCSFLGVAACSLVCQETMISISGEAVRQ